MLMQTTEMYNRWRRENATGGRGGNNNSKVNKYTTHTQHLLHIPSCSSQPRALLLGGGGFPALDIGSLDAFSTTKAAFAVLGFGAAICINAAAALCVQGLGRKNSGRRM